MRGPLNRWENADILGCMSAIFSYDPLTGILCRNGVPVGTKTKLGYIVTSYKRRQYKVHRIAWALFYNRWPSGFIDHINGNVSDNRIENLRDTSIRGNGQNRVEHRNGKYCGDTLNTKGGGYTARISIGKKCINLGTYQTDKLASEAYWKAVAILDNFSEDDAIKRINDEIVFPLHRKDRIYKTNYKLPWKIIVDLPSGRRVVQSHATEDEAIAAKESITLLGIESPLYKQPGNGSNYWVYRGHGDAFRIQVPLPTGGQIRASFPTREDAIRRRNEIIKQYGIIPPINR